MCFNISVNSYYTYNLIQTSVVATTVTVSLLHLVDQILNPPDGLVNPILVPADRALPFHGVLILRLELHPGHRLTLDLVDHLTPLADDHPDSVLRNLDLRNLLAESAL